MSELPRALEGVAVVELGHGIAGPFAARLLADLGAEVIKVEKPPGGDFARRLEPFMRDDAGVECSALFEYLNWNKRSVALDLGDPQGLEWARLLVGRAAIVIESFRPGRLERWGLGAAAMRALNPSLVVTSVSSFGATGPYSDWLGSDLVFQAMAGVAQISGSAEREPIKRGLRQSLYCAGINAAYASLAGYLTALRTGAGVHIDLAIRECPASELVLNESFYFCMGAVQGRRPTARDPLGGPLGGGDPLPAADGHVALQVSPQVTAARLSDLLEEPLLAAPRFATSERRAANAQELVEILSARLAKENAREFFERACSEGALCGIVQGAGELLDCRQLRDRKTFRTVPGLGELRFPLVLGELSRTPASIRSRAPRLGEHSEEILADLAGGPRPAANRAGADAASGAPLAGVRVLDLSYVFAAPYIGGLLADLGAEVIKVEAPHRLDQTRSAFSPFFENEPGAQYWNRAGAFHVVNRGKRALSLDLATEGGREILRSLVSASDILLENYTPRVMRGWGLAYAELAAVNPRLIMLSNSGFGSDGPWAGFRAQGTTLEATMGFSRYAGYVDGPPSKVGQSYPDFLACWSGLLALMAALVYRERTGEGQSIDLGMYQLGVSVMPEPLLRHQLSGEEVPRSGSAEPDALFGGVFRALGDDHWLAVSALSEAQLDALGRVVGADAPAAELTGAVAAWALAHEAAQGAGLLQAAGVPAGPVLDASELFADPQLRERGFYEWVEFADGVARPLIGRPYRWSGAASTVAIRGAGPAFGEANGYVLEEILSLDRAQIAAIRAGGIVTDTPVATSPEEPLDLSLMLRSGALARVDSDHRRVLAAARSGSRASEAAAVAPAGSRAEHAGHVP